MINLTRRNVAVGVATFLALAGMRAPLMANSQPPMTRVILDNDFSGDPDGLFQLAHHILSTSVDIPLIVGSHLPGGMPWITSERTASDAVEKAQVLLEAMGRSGAFEVLAGAETAIPARDGSRPSPATAAIVREAMRDAASPLVYAAGAGLTEPALAWLAEPRIGPRMRLVWIGGEEHAGLATPPPGPGEIEFNFSIDPLAAQILFNESDIEIWQVPRNVYRQLLFSQAELRALADSGPLGEFLKGEIEGIVRELADVPVFAGAGRSETWVMGDNPLVTLTALLSPIQPDPSSSTYISMPTPRLTAEGAYETNPAGRPMRVYTAIDSRLTFADMMLKFRAAGPMGAAAH